MKNKNSEFSLSFVHPDELRKIVLSLKNSKSFGMDNIDKYMLKLMIDHILPAVTNIVNISIQKSEFSCQYKIAKIIPLLKAKNYCPVAILPILSKVVIDIVIFIQIGDYMITMEYFHPNHHAS